MAGMQAYQQAPRTPATGVGQHQNQQDAMTAGTPAGCAAPGAVPPGPTLRRRALDLRRLLHAMRNTTSTSTPAASNHPGSDQQRHQQQLLPSHIIADRLALAQSLLSHLHHTISQLRQSRVDRLNHLTAMAEKEHYNADYERKMDEVEQVRRDHIDQCVGEDGLVQSLTAEVEEVSRLAREDLAVALRREREDLAGVGGGEYDADGDDGAFGDGPARDIIDELFLSPEEDDEEDDEYEDDGMENGGNADAVNGEDVVDDYSLGLSDEENDGTYHQQQQASQNRPSPRQQHHHHHHTGSSSNKTTDEQNEELKRQQAEMLETEIAEMAAQMKSATLRMNTTLREQSNALDDMEQTVTQNLDQVTDVTTKVTDHVSKGWRKTAATWTLLFTVIGTFAFLFMTMRVAPKRRDACIFFCDSRYHAERRSSEYEAKWNQAEEERKRLLEELRLRDESDATDGTDDADAGRREDIDGGRVKDADETDNDDNAVCETLADGTVQCFGGRSSSRKGRRNKKSPPQDDHHENDGECTGDANVGNIAEPQQNTDAHVQEIQRDATTDSAQDELKTNVSEEDSDDDQHIESKEPPAVEEREEISEEEQQRRSEEAVRRRAEDAKRRAIQAEIDQERQREMVEMMERDKKNRRKEEDRVYAEAFKAYSQYKKQTREDMAEEKRKRDERFEQEEKERQEKERLRVEAEKARVEQEEKERQEKERLGVEAVKALVEQERLRVEAENARVEQERIAAAEKKADQERMLEEERLRQEKEEAEAQARAERVKKQEKQKEADRERSERDRIASSENKAAQEEAPSKAISEQEFRHAAATGRLDDVVSFIDRHPDKIDAADANRWTALHEAARAGRTDIIQKLLDAGADATLTTNVGQNALQLLEGKHGTKHPAVPIMRQNKISSDREGENTARSEL